MNELVIKRLDGILVTTSLLVAEKFHKSHKNVLRAIANLAYDQEFMRLNFQPHEYIDARGNTQPVCCITKDGFMLLVFGFNGRDANKLKIMFIDAFNAGQEALAALDNDDAVLARAFNILANKQKALEMQLEQKTEQLALSEKIIKETAPKVQYHDEVLQSKTGHPITVIAAELGITAIKLNRILVKAGAQRKVGGTYVLCEKHLNKGYASSYTHKYLDSLDREQTSILMTWTEIGRKWLIQEYHKYIASQKQF
jgi:Rha family phage regulatory protein